MVLNTDLALPLIKSTPLQPGSADAAIDHLPLQPFTQLPSDGQVPESRSGLCAHDLFASFTVEIMIQEKVFVR
jgi:hypothetical protein